MRMKEARTRSTAAAALTMTVFQPRITWSRFDYLILSMTWHFYRGEDIRNTVVPRKCVNNPHVLRGTCHLPHRAGSQHHLQRRLLLTVDRKLRETARWVQI
jgi:hypothetical protein